MGVTESTEYYRILEIEPGASLEEIKYAYREMAKVWHPDLYPYDSQLRERCEQRMRRINEAYEFLRQYGGQDAVINEEEDEEEEDDVRSPEPTEDEIREFEAAVGPWEGQQTPPPRWQWFRRHIAKNKPDTSGLLQTALAFFIATTVLLSFYFLEHQTSVWYFRLLRTIVTLSSLYGAYFSMCRDNDDIAIALIILALVLNPLLPVTMSLVEWRLFNFLCPLFFLLVFTELYLREYKRGK